MAQQPSYLASSGITGANLGAPGAGVDLGLSLNDTGASRVLANNPNATDAAAAVSPNLSHGLPLISSSGAGPSVLPLPAGTTQGLALGQQAGNNNQSALAAASGTQQPRFYGYEV